MNKSCFLLAAGFTVLQELIYFQTGFAQPENVIEGNKSEFNGIVIEKNRSEASGSVIEGNKSEDTGVVIAKNNEDTTGVVIAKNTTSAGGGQKPVKSPDAQQTITRKTTTTTGTPSSPRRIARETGRSSVKEPRIKPVVSTTIVQKTVVKPQSKPIVTLVTSSTIPRRPTSTPARIAEPTPKSVVTLEPTPIKTPITEPTPAQQLPKNLQKANFLCIQENNQPTTVIELNQQKKLPVILWESEEFKEIGYDPQKRCELVSKRLAAYSKDSKFNYLTTGKIDGNPVICFTDQVNGECVKGTPERDGILITLSKGTNPDETLETLVALLETQNSTMRSPLQQ